MIYFLQVICYENYNYRRFKRKNRGNIYYKFEKKDLKLLKYNKKKKNF